MEEETKKSHSPYATYVIIGLVLVCITVICFIIFFLHGNITVVKNSGDIMTQKKLICKSTSTTYPLFAYDNSENKSMDITATFNNDTLDTISLIYKLFYSNTELIAKSESANHGALNILSQDEGLGPDVFEAKFSKLKNALQLSLYGKNNEINDKTIKYFMLNGLDEPHTKDKLMKIYTEQGFICEAQE